MACCWLQLLTMAMFLASAMAISQTIDPSCPKMCGDVEIPYPFGVQEGCFLNKDFNITCQSGKPLLLAPNSTLEIKNISILTNEISVYTPMSKACYNNTGFINATDISVSSPTFPFSNTKNKFTAIGCDTFGLIAGDDFITGCFSFCLNSSSVDSNGSCLGGGCCQNSLSPGLHDYIILLSSGFDHKNGTYQFNPCDYAFFGDDSYVFKGLSDFQELDKGMNASTVLDWSIKNQTCSEAKVSSSFACKGHHTTCVDSQHDPGYYCQCSRGFEGNPYIANGCEDICKLRTCRSRIIKLASILSAVVLVVFIVGVIVMWRHLRKKRINELKEKYFRQNGGPALQESLSQLEDAQTAFKVFTAKEMEEATNNFDENRIVGRGGFGVVYKGYLSDGREVAIKKSKSVDKYEIDQFVNEVVLLSKIQHQNVVGFFGCCLETSEPLLVYEYITNGSLLDHLYNEDDNAVLPWEIRVKIVVETAGVLGYLHQDHRPQIIHSDIKPHNILLDENYNTKVSDFGISKLAPQNETELYTMVKGTLGYLDPEFIQSSQLTDKSDVYSFGVVLLEILTGQRVLSFDRPEKDRTLVKYFRSSVDEGSLLEIFDRKIMNQENVEELKVVAKIAGICVSIKADERPTMKEVAMELGSLWIQVKKRCIASGVDVEWRKGHVVGNGVEFHGDTSTTIELTTTSDPLLLQRLGSGR